MIAPNEFREVLSVYEKHGWKLERLLTPDEPSAELLSVTGDVPVKRWELDAAWFTRSSRPGTVTWELRYLAAAPVAFVSVIDDGSDPQEELHLLEQKLLDTVRRRSTGEGAQNGTS